MSITKSEQPTAEDIGNMLAYSKAKAEEETRRKQEEERKQEEARQREYDFQKSEIAIIIKQRKKYPVIEGEPYVLILWSEHPAFYEWNDKRSLYLSITACDNILRIIENLDKGFGIGGYKKTKFEIHQPDGNHYEGRYDIGDGDGGIIKHIEGIAKWDLEHPEYGGIEGAKERLNFVQYLKQFIKGA